MRLIWIAALCLICPICSNGDGFGYLNFNSLTSTADRILSRSADAVFSDLIYVILCGHAWILLCVSDKRGVLLCPALCVPLVCVSPSNNVCNKFASVDGISIPMKITSRTTSSLPCSWICYWRASPQRCILRAFLWEVPREVHIYCIFLHLRRQTHARCVSGPLNAQLINASETAQIQNLTLPGDSSLKKKKKTE
jgi:hypothetical protein